MRKYIFIALCFYLLFPIKAHALQAATDNANGFYSAQVLEKVLQKYVKPEGASGFATVLVRIGRDGRPFSCEFTKNSTYPAADSAICSAVAEAAPFPLPPNNIATVQVVMSFVYDSEFPIGGEANALSHNTFESVQDFSSSSAPVLAGEDTAASSAPQYIGGGVYATPLTSSGSSQGVQAQNYTQAPANNSSSKKDLDYAYIATLPYADQIMAIAEPQLHLPETFPAGNYRTQVKVRISPAGALVNYTVLQASHSKEFDLFIEKMLFSGSVIPVPANGKTQELTLTFNVNNERKSVWDEENKAK